MLETDHIMSGPEVLAAHRDLTPILASLALAWTRKAKDAFALASHLQFEAHDWFARLPGDERAAPSAAQERDHRATENRQRASELHSEGRVLMELAEEANAGFLALTDAQLKDPGTVPFLTAEVIEMAKATGRLKLIG